MVDFAQFSKQEVVDAVIAHARNFEFMSGVDRSAHRIKQSGEIFTPTALVQEMLSHLPFEIFSDSSKTVIDPSCGDGQFLSEVLIRKLENGIAFEDALRNIYGIDIKFDNVELCRNRLLCGQESLRYIVNHNIVCGDALTYNYDRFDLPLIKPV